MITTVTVTTTATVSSYSGGALAMVAITFLIALLITKDAVSGSRHPTVRACTERLTVAVWPLSFILVMSAGFQIYEALTR